jgi:hypothetical protein
MIPEVLLITGARDFNFHVDCPTEADAKKFADLMNTFGLIQHVHVPTHSSGHTLDLIITRSVGGVTITSPLATFALSDHFLLNVCWIFLAQTSFTKSPERHSPQYGSPGGYASCAYRPKLVDLSAACRIIFWAHFFRICLVTKPDPRWRPSVAKQLTFIFTARNSTEIPLR